jgi:hypothetical protein
MMKRPRSFISTLFIFFCLATVTLGLTTYVRRAEAGAMPRLMDPRAGDPDEPSPGFLITDEISPGLPAENSTDPILRNSRPSLALIWFRILMLSYAPHSYTVSTRWTERR